jgi:hypothetical protein
MEAELQNLIRELLYGPVRGHRYRPTPEQIEQNKREKAIQREINERVYRKATPDTLPTDSTDNTEQRDTA